MDWIMQPWPWYVAGPLIALVMFLLLFFGENFGMSNNLRTLCAMSGGGKWSDFFRFNWRSQIWNLVFALGAVVGGFIAYWYLIPSDSAVALASNTVAQLESLGINDPGKNYLPDELFGLQAVGSIKGLSILFIGGVLVGFGARYAGGCTSGHAISGLSDLQIPSLIAVVGFFIGGLTMVYLLFPVIFS